jgi:hypothetical protein
MIIEVSLLSKLIDYEEEISLIESEFSQMKINIFKDQR